MLINGIVLRFLKMSKNNKKPSISFQFASPGSFLKNRILLKEFLVALFKKEKKGLRSLTYIFCSDEYLLQINQQFLKHDFFTDIITFELSGDEMTEGEVYISIDRIKENAIQFGTGLQEELHRVIFHGALHLCGYVDKTKPDKTLMTKKENTYLKSYLY